MPNTTPIENNLINSTNPNSFIYCICLKMYDYYKINNENESPTNGYIEVIEISRVFCFMTMYPFLEFFVE